MIYKKGEEGLGICLIKQILYLMVPVMQNVSPDKGVADEDTAEDFLLGAMLFVCLFASC